MTASPVVDVVIAVHDPRRRLDRAIQSLAGASARIRVTVVCHGISAASVAGLAPDSSEAWVRVVEFTDGIRSPAGPFNHGLRAATAEYVMIMGSDDFLEPGAMDAWIDAAVGGGVDIQLAPLRHQNGELLANPLTRPWRRRRLDPVRDRLFQRTAPLGLIRRELIGAGRVGGPGPLTEGLPTGEDLAWSSALWTSGRRIDLHPRHPAYVIGADDGARTSMQPLAVAQALAPVDALVAGEWSDRQPRQVRAALVAKLLRVNLLGALRVRPSSADWPSASVAAAAHTLTTLEGYEPRGFRDLPRADRALLDAVRVAGAEGDDIAAAIAQHSRANLAGRLLPRNPLRAFGRESVLRRYARYLIDRRR